MVELLRAAKFLENVPVFESEKRGGLKPPRFDFIFANIVVISKGVSINEFSKKDIRVHSF